MSEDFPPVFMRSRLQLMLRHPYLANAVARLPVVNASDMPWCETMATDGYYIYVSPEFCTNHTEEELTGVIAHEIMHCVLGHIDRRGTRERTLWNVAIDYAVNLLLVDAGFQLPKEGLLDRKYRGMTAEEIYDAFLSAPDEQGDEMAGGAESEGGQDGKSGKPGGTPDKRAPGGFDDHIEPGDIEGSSERAKDFPTNDERIRIRSTLGKELISKIGGREAGYLAEEVRRASTAKISWQQLLSRFFTGLRRDDYRSYPFNHKHLWRGIYLPSIGTPGPEHIVIAVDTSGSMSDEQLSQALAEIDALRATANCKLTLIQCDAVIQSIDEYEAWEMSEKTFKKVIFLGRGGTSFIPIFDWIKANVLRSNRVMDALIYITDGYGSFPKEKPDYPALWIVPQSGMSKPPFGELIRM